MSHKRPACFRTFPPPEHRPQTSDGAANRPRGGAKPENFVRWWKCPAVGGDRRGQPQATPALNASGAFAQSVPFGAMLIDEVALLGHLGFRIQAGARAIYIDHYRVPAGR